MTMGTTHSVIVIFKYFTVQCQTSFSRWQPSVRNILFDIEMHSEKEHHNKETYVVTLFNGNTT